MPSAFMPALRDVVTVGPPRLLLVGINPGLRSWALGHHFAGNGNPFWRLLFSAGLVPEPLAFSEAARLADFGIALTNLCPRTTRTAAELTPVEIDRGRRVLARKIARWRPAVAAFVGVSLYQLYFRHPRSGGPGEKPERIDGARVFVVPNPSGLNATFPGFEDKLVWFRKLRAFVDRVAQSSTDRESGRRRAPRPSRPRAAAARSSTESDPS
jgi:double-stranded uracil-DNA glycosylase